MDDIAIGRRVAAARKRAGMNQRRRLTDAVDLRIGPATLGRIERGERHLFPHEADAFAQVLGVDRGFFFENDEPAQADQLERIEAALAERVEHDRKVERLLEQQNELLDRQSDILTRIEALLSQFSPPQAEAPPAAGPDIRYPRRPRVDRRRAPGG